MQNLLPDQQTNLAGLELLKNIFSSNVLCWAILRIGNFSVVDLVAIAEVVVRPIVVH